MGRGGGGGEAAGLPCRLAWLQPWLCTCAVGAAVVVLVPWRNQNATQSRPLGLGGAGGGKPVLLEPSQQQGFGCKQANPPGTALPGAGAFRPVIHGEPPPLPKGNSLSSEKRHGRASLLEGRAPLLVLVDELTAGASQPAPGKRGKFVCSLCWEATRSLLCRLSLSHPRQILPGFPPGSLNPNSSPWRRSWHGFRGKRGGFGCAAEREGWELGRRGPRAAPGLAPQPVPQARPARPGLLPRLLASCPALRCRDSPHSIAEPPWPRFPLGHPLFVSFQCDFFHSFSSSRARPRCASATSPHPCASSRGTQGTVPSRGRVVAVSMGQAGLWLWPRVGQGQPHPCPWCFGAAFGWRVQPLPQLPASSWDERAS